MMAYRFALLKLSWRSRRVKQALDCWQRLRRAQGAVVFADDGGNTRSERGRSSSVEAIRSECMR